MAEEKHFTQAEVDQIIAERLRKERAKISSEVQQRAAELDRREALLAAKEDWNKRGLPVDLLDSLDISKDGALEAAATVLANMKGNRSDVRGGRVGDEIDTESSGDPMRGAFGLK